MHHICQKLWAFVYPKLYCWPSPIKVVFGIIVFFTDYLLMTYKFQCLHQKSEAEKKSATLTFHEPDSTEASMLVKHLQEELRNYVSCILLNIV